MTNNQSKRQQNCRENLHLLASRRSIPVLVLIILMTIASCSDGSFSKSYRKADEALDDYATFYRSLSKKDALSSQKLVSTIKTWKELDDSVSIAVFRDSCHTDRFANDSTYMVLRDSILDKMLELVDSRKRTLKDYLNVVVAANNTKLDTTSQQFVLSVHKFYASMDSVPTLSWAARRLYTCTSVFCLKIPRMACAPSATCSPFCGTKTGPSVHFSLTCPTSVTFHWPMCGICPRF